MASRSSPREKTQPAIAPHDLEIARSQRGAFAAVVQFKAVENDPPRRRREWPQECRESAAAAADKAPAAAGASRPHVEIGAQLGIEPQRNSLSEAAHHNAHAGHHGDGGGQRRHHDRGARERSGQAASRQHRLDAAVEQSARRAVDRQRRTRAWPMPRRRWRGTRRRIRPREMRPTAGACDAATASAANTAGPGQSAPPAQARANARANRGSWLRWARHAMASRAGANAETNAATAPAAMPSAASPAVSSTGAGRLVVKSAFTVPAISCTDRARQQPPQRHARAPPTTPKQQRFGEEHAKDRAAARAQRPQDADLRAPPHHADRDGVVDEKRAHHQRNVAQHAQVPAEGAQHALVLVAARAGLLHEITRRENRADGRFGAREIFGRARR